MNNIKFKGKKLLATLIVVCLIALTIYSIIAIKTM